MKEKSNICDCCSDCRDEARAGPVLDFTAVSNREILSLSSAMPRSHPPALRQPRVAGASDWKSVEVGLRQADLRPVVGAPLPTFVRNRPDDENEIRHILQNYPQVRIPTHEYKPTRRVREVCDHRYRDATDAWEGSGYVPAYKQLGSGGFGMVYIGFKYADQWKPFEERHFVAMKEERLRCLSHISHSSDSSSSVPSSQQSAMAAANILLVMSGQAAAGQPHVSLGDQVCDKSIVMETLCLRHLRHKNVVRMLGNFMIDDLRTFFTILEYCDGGDLLSLVDHPDVELTSAEVRYLMKQAVAGIKYLHQNRIAHRDIKPANILLRIKEKVDTDEQHMPRTRTRLECKIADFGLSAIYSYLDPHHDDWEETLGQNMCGTRSYMAPEALLMGMNTGDLFVMMKRFSPIPLTQGDIEAGYEDETPRQSHRKALHLAMFTDLLSGHRMPPLDIWSLGVTFYYLLANELPYRCRDFPIGIDLIFRGDAKRAHTKIMDEDFAFFKFMCEPHPDNRPMIEAVESHPWLSDPSLLSVCPELKHAKFKDFLKVTPENWEDRIEDHMDEGKYFKPEGHEFLGLEGPDPYAHRELVPPPPAAPAHLSPAPPARVRAESPAPRAPSAARQPSPKPGPSKRRHSDDGQPRKKH